MFADETIHMLERRKKKSSEIVLSWKVYCYMQITVFFYTHKFSQFLVGNLFWYILFCMIKKLGPRLDEFTSVCVCV